jgi:hypothetical protein
MILRGCEKMGLAPSGCPCFAGISRSCEVPVPIFSQPLRDKIQFEARRYRTSHEAPEAPTAPFHRPALASHRN